LFYKEGVDVKTRDRKQLGGAGAMASEGKRKESPTKRVAHHRAAHRRFQRQPHMGRIRFTTATWNGVFGLARQLPTVVVAAIELTWLEGQKSVSLGRPDPNRVRAWGPCDCGELSVLAAKTKTDRRDAAFPSQGRATQNSTRLCAAHRHCSLFGDYVGLGI